jgi:hypothetical protein
VTPTKEAAARHTPGPWKMHHPSSVVGSLVSYGDLTKGENICTVMPQLDIAVCEANARLISAAPELLDSLEQFVALANFDADTLPKTTEEWDAMVTEAEVAIAKAKGIMSKGEK